MKKFIARKIFRYDPTFESKYSKYRGYQLIGLQKISPNIVTHKDYERISGIDSPILCSELTRSIETASLFQEDLKVGEILKTPQLNEVLFDLGNLLTQAEFRKFGSSLVRRRFVNAFIGDTLLEKREQIQFRIDNLLSELNKYKEGKYLLISHSFLMKIMQTYIHDRELFEDPTLLGKYFDFTQKTYEFGEGFEFLL